MAQFAKSLIAIGAICIAVGLVLIGVQKLGLGRLPGDFAWKGKYGSFHFPLATSLLVSVVLTVLVNLWLRRSR